MGTSRILGRGDGSAYDNVRRTCGSRDFWRRDALLVVPRGRFELDAGSDDKRTRWKDAPKILRFVCRGDDTVAAAISRQPCEARDLCLYGGWQPNLGEVTVREARDDG